MVRGSCGPWKMAAFMVDLLTLPARSPDITCHLSRYVM
jgi:hypothetical protein